ncbi:hypothetical protein [Mesorhizobium sp. L-8-10]|uniref:hypothetical protein n=1 Tax=Mesorhizobium sp. L-8-10 TaxID=2744523 RepID=UPI001925A222|nr:hypothetical protein [Mesorhizobium sp. L-8-10]
MKLDLARATEATHSREAVKVYVERVDELVRTGGNQAYEEAVKLIRHIASLRDGREQSTHVAALKESAMPASTIS